MNIVRSIQTAVFVKKGVWLTSAYIAEYIFNRKNPDFNRVTISLIGRNLRKIKTEELFRAMKLSGLSMEFLADPSLEGYKSEISRLIAADAIKTKVN